MHTLDGADHRHRKAMFLRLLRDPMRVADLVDSVGLAWDKAAPGWARPAAVSACGSTGSVASCELAGDHCA